VQICKLLMNGFRSCCYIKDIPHVFSCFNFLLVFQVSINIGSSKDAVVRPFGIIATSRKSLIYQWFERFMPASSPFSRKEDTPESPWFNLTHCNTVSALRL